jgi:hypothetical protein
MSIGNYKTAFPDFDNGPALEELAGKLAEADFKDISWGNDACPSLWGPVDPARDDEEAGVRIWVEYADPALREVAVEGDKPGFSAIIVLKDEDDEMTLEIICTEGDPKGEVATTHLLRRTYQDGKQVSEEPQELVGDPIEVVATLAQDVLRAAREAAPAVRPAP